MARQRWRGSQRQPGEMDTGERAVDSGMETWDLGYGETAIARDPISNSKNRLDLKNNKFLRYGGIAAAVVAAGVIGRITAPDNDGSSDDQPRAYSAGDCLPGGISMVDVTSDPEASTLEAKTAAVTLDAVGEGIQRIDRKYAVVVGGQALKVTTISGDTFIGINDTQTPQAWRLPDDPCAEPRDSTAWVIGGSGRVQTAVYSEDEGARPICGLASTGEIGECPQGVING